MKDAYNRKIDYLRVSVTDRCNLRCRYCMPQGIDLLPMSDILTLEEIVMVCREAAALGIQKIKVTGGEPLVRKGCIWLIGQLKAIPGIQAVTLTTNGVLLPEFAKALADAGIDGINISIDTLNPVRFHEITGAAALDQVKCGLERCLSFKIRVKINAVLQRGINDQDWKPLVGLARDYPVDVRFIEMMPIGHGIGYETIPNPEIRERLEREFGTSKEDDRIHGNGPAVYYQLEGFQGSIGFISALHGKFCADCNRIRMTSTGDLKPCLCFAQSISVKDAVRSGDGQLVRALLTEAVQSKPGMHLFEHRQEITEKKNMVQIGG